MLLKIFHTADIHLGMKFANYPSELIQARFDTLSRCVEIANNKKCDLFVIAGDLFDKKTINKPNILKTAKILSGFEGELVIVLPGNHDFISSAEKDIWIMLKDSIIGGNVLILGEAKKYELSPYGLNANLYAAPCDLKTSKDNRVGWITPNLIDKDINYHIGIAHGALEGLSADLEGKYFSMTEDELSDKKLDLWLLGHIHVAYPEKPGKYDKIFYSGTPEPDGFDCHHEGKAWIIEIDEEKKIITEQLSTGTYRFIHEEIQIGSLDDLDKVKQKYASGDYSKHLIKLKFTGCLPRDAYKELPEYLRNIKSQFFYSLIDYDELMEQITMNIINSEFPEDSIPHQLLTQIEKEGEPDILQTAYQLIQEAKQ